MSTFNEADHPRLSDGKFTDKPQSAPEVSLVSAPPPPLTLSVQPEYWHHDQAMPAGDPEALDLSALAGFVTEDDLDDLENDMEAAERIYERLVVAGLMPRFGPYTAMIHGLEEYREWLEQQPEPEHTFDSIQPGSEQIITADEHPAIAELGIERLLVSRDQGWDLHFDAEVPIQIDRIADLAGPEWFEANRAAIAEAFRETTGVEMISDTSARVSLTPILGTYPNVQALLGSRGTAEALSVVESLRGPDPQPWQRVHVAALQKSYGLSPRT